MSGHGNTGKHLGALPKTVQRMLIEQAVARHGTPYKAAERLGLPVDQVLEVWQRMQEALDAGDATLYRRPAVCKHPCGTYPAYQFHMSHGEPLDDACKAAGNARSRFYARRVTERRSA